MSQDKQKLFILCGGQSAEHEVSIVSAKSIVRTLDQNKYQIYVVYIAKNGAWFLLDHHHKAPPNHRMASAAKT